MSKSIISNARECYVCSSTYNLHKHHIYGGSRRNLSEKYGCWVYLCPPHHNMSDHGVHFNKALDNDLKGQCQKAWENKYGSREQFIDTFIKSYL